MGTWMWVGAGVKETASGVPDTMETLCPAGTLTGIVLLTVGLRAMGWPGTDIWVVMGLNIPAGFCVTIVLVPVWTRVTPPPAVGETIGRVWVTKGPVGRKDTAAIVTLEPTGSTVGGRVEFNGRVVCEVARGTDPC